jgi:hypothetical protein
MLKYQGAIKNKFMENENKNTYNNLNFSKLSQALKANISRRKAAKQEKETSNENETSKSD